MKSDVLTQEIKDLSEGIEYAFRVIATNEYGRSDPLTSDPVAPKSLFGNYFNCCLVLFDFVIVLGIFIFKGFSHIFMLLFLL